MMQGQHLLLPLNRPQHVAMNEILITSLLWNDLSTQDSTIDWQDGHNVIPLAFDTSDSAKDKIGGKARKRVFSQALQGEDTRFSEFVDKEFKTTLETRDNISKTLALSLRGTQSDGSNVSSVLPITPAIGLTMNRAGALSQPRPPNLAALIEQIHALGSREESKGEKTAAEKLVSSLQDRLSNDKFLQGLDTIVHKGILPVGFDLEFGSSQVKTENNNPFPWDAYNAFTESEAGSRTPFRWFYDNWTELNDPYWIKTLPARRWHDWATMLLRVGTTFGYLWSLHWYQEVGRLVLNKDEKILKSDVFSQELISRINQKTLFKWEDRSSKPSERSVTEQTRADIKKGSGVQEVLDSYIKEDLGTMPAGEAILCLAQSEEIKNEIEAKLFPEDTDISGAAKNRWETIKYVLLPRSTTGEQADHFAFLKKYNDKMAIVDPATEWIAVVTSLLCERGSKKTDLGTIRENLSNLGLYPSNKELLWHLEKAGLARGTADADDAVEVSGAF